ncbi:uncharacterized protein C8Q71DRAFT_141738 [Rhodofomes roseus]|uniref:Secreted protein n=1 Tax=Rhodofomes roseus TaxID=34475 RepID=A0ABQ8KBL1_9APHY|nr:uncharacterized protein C8Q71DRAFT_141738 [Rhodofomes roseus]KAH9834445.1 hypothetical protein C8Q71DRAFT_141738 [Rhodofomes roseus]
MSDYRHHLPLLLLSFSSSPSEGRLVRHTIQQLNSTKCNGQRATRTCHHESDVTGLPFAVARASVLRAMTKARCSLRMSRAFPIVMAFTELRVRGRRLYA